MTNRYFAFLRAINVGGRYVKMDILKEIFVELGFENVDTYIQSGNVIFDTEKGGKANLEDMIEQQLQNDLEFEVPTFLRTIEEMKKIVDLIPFDNTDESASLYVSFTRDEPEKKIVQRIEALSSDIDKFKVIDNQIYWLYHRSQGKSKVTNSKLERLLKSPATRRNINTVRKIMNKYSGKK